MCGILAVATAAAERRENNLARYLFRAISIFYFVFFFSIRFFFSRALVSDKKWNFQDAECGEKIDFDFV